MNDLLHQHKQYKVVENVAQTLRCSQSMRLHLEQLFAFAVSAHLDFEEVCQQCLNPFERKRISKQDSLQILDCIERELISRF